jgi:LmbE family N-acetylglucosaminyl deacetylase
VTAPDFVTSYTQVGETLMPVLRPVPRRLLGVWAHPDDEAYMSAGLMARVIDHGGAVTVLTATRGELGTSDADLAGSAAFGSFRERELRASLGELGVDDMRMLGLPDGGCLDADAESQIAAIGALIDEVRPDLIVTFGPDGITWHPDHLAVWAWTTEAWRRSHHDASLMYAAFSVDKVREFGDLHARIGLFDDFGDGQPAPAALTDIGVECSLDRAELARKRRALAAHHSQTAGLAALLGEAKYLEWVRVETFRHPTAADIAGIHTQRVPVGVMS